MNAQRREATGLSIFSKVLLQYHAMQAWNSVGILQYMSVTCATVSPHETVLQYARNHFSEAAKTPRNGGLISRFLDQTTGCDHVDMSQRALPRILPCTGG